MVLGGLIIVVHDSRAKIGNVTESFSPLDLNYTILLFKSKMQSQLQ